jgi:hypothetical protein
VGRVDVADNHRAADRSAPDDNVPTSRLPSEGVELRGDLLRGAEVHDDALQRRAVFVGRNGVEKMLLDFARDAPTGSNASSKQAAEFVDVRSD